MMDYVNLLLDAVNNYDENDEKSKDKLRDLVCIISDNKELQKDALIRELLYTASHKMRIFGYNVQNGFYQKNVVIEQNSSEAMWLRNESIRNRYKSKLRSNNILDKTQHDIIDFYQSLPKKRMLVSAPTSYGKTFIMREILFLNNERYNNVLLVFPTVALLRENALTMEEISKGQQLGYNVIKSIDNEVDVEGRNIFVFTPERALQLLASYPDIQIDFFFYDEMYKIDEDYCIEDTDDEMGESTSKNPYKNKNFLDEGRAKTFRICLYLLSKRVKEYYLAGPNLKREKFGLGMQRYIALNNIEVKEIEFEPTKRIQVKAYNTKIDEDYTDLYFLPKPEPMRMRNAKNDRICDVVDYIGKMGYGATMLYCTNPSKANEYATKLAQQHMGKKIISERFLFFIAHLKRNYNINGSVEKWSFVNVLEKGFGMHHGKMPKYIQKEVLELFNDGVYDLLFCTSTIVEGVNTNAKNMVVLNHSKGSSPLTVFDFKNIIGRAGRYYHNFVGRYFLVDKELKKFENTEDLELNFVTYDEPGLDAIDIDNSEFDDLMRSNKKEKENRIQQQKHYLLTDDVFVKNRLIKKENQEKLLRFLLEDDELYNKFYDYSQYTNILIGFTKYHAMSTVLDIFEKAGLLDEVIVKVYKGINEAYCTEGFRGLLKFELNQTSGIRYDKKGNIRKNKTVDKAYMDAFKTQKDVVEHKFPKLLALFETIFSNASFLRKKDIGNFTLSKVTRFYETGVKSYFGEQLVEFGFPVDAIRRIEDKNAGLLTMGAEASKNYVKEYRYRIKQELDEYEKILFEKALKSIL